MCQLYTTTVNRYSQFSQGRKKKRANTLTCPGISCSMKHFHLFYKVAKNRVKALLSPCSIAFSHTSILIHNESFEGLINKD